MKRSVTLLATLLLSALMCPLRAQNQNSFHPQVTAVLGTNEAHAPIAFTRVFTQRPGELAIDHDHEVFTNLEINQQRFFQLVALGGFTPLVPIGSMNMAFGNESMPISCVVDLSKFNPATRTFVVLLILAPGSPNVGQVIGQAQYSQSTDDNGQNVITVDARMIPGMMPNIMPTAFVDTDQIIPDLFQTGNPGEVRIEHTFFSVQPPDGSPVMSFTDVQNFPIKEPDDNRN